MYPWLRAWLFALLCIAWPVSADEADVESATAREKCAHHDPLRRPFFGDLHVHTALSLDASTQGTVKRPADAYRFAQGEPLDIQPYDATGKGLRRLQLSQPLDFAAVTDHAELLGEVHICNAPGAPGHDSWVCGIYRRWPRLAFYLMNWRASRGDPDDPPARWGFCGDEGETCIQASRGPWSEIQAAAEAATDRSPACSFTAFVAYEWTGAAGSGNNTHRNVIFRNDRVPALPISFIEAPSPELLWEGLDETCHATGDCEAVIIPHNSNLSGGMMFPTLERDGSPLLVRTAAKRQRYEVLAEVMQHKGDSECAMGLDSEDEACGFEKLAMSNFSGRYQAWAAEPPVARQFLRNTLKTGLVAQLRLGVNPFKYGLIASTDTHLAAPGAAEESGYLGHGGAGEPARDAVPPGLPDAADLNPGGLAVLWAEENSRESLFASLRRREAYGTSGTRPIVRLFGGWSYPEDLCGRIDFVEVGYRDGVPMGGDLSPPPAEASSPRLAVSALRDPVHPGTQLERVQIIKGWVDASGKPRERVYDVAGYEPGRASVDTRTCAVSGPGADSLCSVWTDPDFDASLPAFYYARILENPTCRWTTLLCNASSIDCAVPATVTEGFEPCCDLQVPRSVQERAWTSPIWYTPTVAAP